MFILGGLAMAGIAWMVDANILVTFGVCVLGTVLEFVPRRFTVGELRHRPAKRTRADDEKWLRDNGYLPKTKQEAWKDAEERRIANTRFSDPPDGTYYDREWRLRDIHTDRLI